MHVLFGVYIIGFWLLVQAEKKMLNFLLLIQNYNQHENIGFEMSDFFII